MLNLVISISPVTDELAKEHNKVYDASSREQDPTVIRKHA